MNAVVLSGMNSLVLSGIEARAIRNPGARKSLSHRANFAPSNSSSNTKKNPNGQRQIAMPVDNALRSRLPIPSATREASP